jgi:3-hydroxyisobutyrate dehydrogenase-like beta-hydroxyacid dehydrogenase
MRIGLIGYGEVGRILAEDLRARCEELAAYDLKLSTEVDKPLREHAARLGVTLTASHAAAVRRSDLVISAVTASQAVAAAQDCASALAKDTFFLDLNSVSPGTKQRAAELIQAAGGRYVEGAVMAAVRPSRLKVPLLLGGPHAAALEPLLIGLDFAASVASKAFGVASAIKMCRSVVIKGLEAIVIEAFVAARHFGVEDEVVASLQETFPGVDWEHQAAYFFQRVIEHGRRRSEEVREAAATIQEAGLTPWSASGTAERQAWVADLADAGALGPRGSPEFVRCADWRIEADRILKSKK